MAPAECLNSGVVTAAWPPTRPLLVKRGTRRAIKVPIEEWGGGGGFLQLLLSMDTGA